MKLKIGIVVHGRFHAFDLARAILARGHDVTVLTNYPAWAVERFGIPKRYVRSHWPHGVLSRLSWKLHQSGLFTYRESWLHHSFGAWAAKHLSRERWDVIHCWSGVSEESLRDSVGKAGLRLVMRGSAHIRTQARLLMEEACRTGVALEHPSEWMIAREEREYALAGKIIVLSTFARDSFVQQGVDPSKLRLLPLGAALDAFQPSAQVVEARHKRILSGERLRVLFVGAMSLQKGLWDLASVVRQLGAGNFVFRLVGPRLPEADGLLGDLRNLAAIDPKQPQARLPEVYAWADVFVFPTIQDGYAVVLAQAAASGLPIIATTNCAGPDLVHEGETGWILPIRCPEAFVERLQWCNSHRAELAEMARRIPAQFKPRDWADVAADFEHMFMDNLNTGLNLPGHTT